VKEVRIASVVGVHEVFQQLRIYTPDAICERHA